MASKREREPSGAFAADSPAGPASKSAAPAPKKPRLEDVEGDDSDSDPSTPQDLKPTKSTKAKDARKRRQGPSEVAEEISHKFIEEIQAMATAFANSTDIYLVNTRRLADVLLHIEMTAMIKPVQPDHARKSLDQMVESLSPIPGRDIRLYETTATATGWSLRFREHGPDSSKLFTGKTYSATVTEDRLATGPDNKPEAKKIGEKCAAIMNAWPYPMGTAPRIFSANIVNIALDQVLGATLKRVREVTVAPELYTTYVTFYDDDPAVRDFGQLHISATPSNEAMASVQVPKLPPMFLIKKELGTGRGSERVDEVKEDGVAPVLEAPKTMPKPSSPASQVTAQNLVRFIAWQCHGLVGTRASIQELIDFWLSKLGYKALKTHGIYGGNPLYTISVERSNNTIGVFPSVAVAKDMLYMGDILGRARISKLRINIRSLNASRITPVLDSLVQNYFSKPHVGRAFLLAAQIADVVNKDILEGVPPSSACDCDETATGTELHVCERCVTPTLCKTRTFDGDGLLVCSGCAARAAIQAQQGDYAGLTMAKRKIRESFTASFRRECAHTGIDPHHKQNAAAHETALAELYATLPSSGKGTVYADQYAGKQRDITYEVPNPGGNPSMRRYTPTMLSVDAIFPRMPSKLTGDRFFAHTEGNVAVIACVLNYAKFTHLPGVLAEIAKFLAKPTPDAAKRLLAALDALHKLRLKMPYTKAARSTKIDLKAHQKYMQECISGKLIQAEHGPWEISSRRWTLKPKKPTSSGVWDVETRQRLGTLTVEMEEEFKHKLPRASDGAPYFGHADTMPDDWSWDAAGDFCEERLERMRLVCNKKWQTQDTTESLFAEIVYQTCCGSPYGDGLGLPLVLWIGHPLRLSIAHKHHGSQMRTGWPPYPSKLEERDDELNNILVESWFWNVAKLDMDEAYYKDAMALLKSISMPSKYYNPSGDAPTDVDPEMADLKEVIGQAQDIIGEQVDTTANPEIMTTDDDEMATGTADDDKMATELTAPSSSAAVEDEEAEAARREAQTQHAEVRKGLKSEAAGVRAYMTEECAKALHDDPTIAPLMDDLDKYADNGDSQGVMLMEKDINNKLAAWRKNLEL